MFVVIGGGGGGVDAVVVFVCALVVIAVGVGGLVMAGAFDAVGAVAIAVAVVMYWLRLLLPVLLLLMFFLVCSLITYEHLLCHRREATLAVATARISRICMHVFLSPDIIQ